MQRTNPMRHQGALATAVTLGFTLVVGQIAAAAEVTLADIVAQPSAINDFEAGPAVLVGNTWVEQGIRVTQVNGDAPNGIWLASGFGNGQRSWYPDVGDDGWTRITLDSGDNFDAVSFFGGAGILAGMQTLYFELLDDGALVLSGTRDSSFFGSWFGFSGGDFDEIRLRARDGLVTSMDDCLFPQPGLRCNYAWVDDIRIGSAQVPEPATLALSLLGLGIGRISARRRGQHR